MSSRAPLAFVLFLFPLGIAHSQTAPFSCQTSAVNLNVRSEGIAEPLGDIVFTCSGGVSGSTVLFNLAVSLNVNVTNRVSTSGVTDATLTIDSGAGPVPSAVPALLQTSNSVAFNGISFTIPASGRVALRISNLRGNVSQLGPGSQQSVIATLGLSSGSPSTVIIVNTSQLSIGSPSRGLLATLADAGIRCVGSPLPATITFSNLLAGTAFVSTRVTEGFATAFDKKLPGADNGVRIIARYAGLPRGARLFIPDVVAGSDAVQPTIAGDLGGTPSGGSYAPGGAGSLLLVRVIGTDANGAGGALAFTPGAPGSGVVTFNSASEIPLTNGAGIAVYEVVDSNPNVVESAQFATFLGLAPITDGSVGPIASEEISLGPVSTVGSASATDPIPRFISIPAPSDCSSLHDCGASYFPSLNVVVSRPLDFTAPLGSPLQTKTVQIQNLSGGVMSWTATVVNSTGPAGWLTVAPDSGANGGTIFVNVFPGKISATGLYTGTIIIDTGAQTGSRTLNVTATITAAPALPPVVVPTVSVLSLTSAARTDVTAVAPGSLAFLTGAHLKGKDVAVTFDGAAAMMLWGDDATIALQIPPTLHAPATSQLQVTVDGVKSAPLAVPVSELAPAIFSTHGLLNADWSTNSPSNPADGGSQMQILSTGLMGSVSAPVFVKLYGRMLTPTWAGPAPGLVGIDELVIDLPDDLPSVITQIAVCGYASANPSAEVCSPPSTVAIK